MLLFRFAENWIDIENSCWWVLMVSRLWGQVSVSYLSKTLVPCFVCILDSREFDHIGQFFFCVCLVLCCLPVSHPQQGPSGHPSSACCHGEMFPAWIGFALWCEDWSCSRRSKLFLSNFGTFSFAPGWFQTHFV